MAETATPVEVFCCYSHADEAWLRKLETHLSLLKRQCLVSLWHNQCIVPGADWAKTIDTHLESASVILLLVSADFLDSDYCYGVEMKRALERHAADEARVVPILVRPVDWKNAPFAHLQVLPTDAKPIVSWRNKERALADVAAGIRHVMEDVPLLVASAPRAALPTIWNVPYPRNPFFLGRDVELAHLRSHLQAGQVTALAQPQAISGLGGIGKTQLALEYAYRYHQDYQAVLWVRAESTEALISSYAAAALLLRLPECEAKEQEMIAQAVKTWLQTHRDWLLILDNADELALLPHFLPASQGGHLLLTTRAAAIGRLAHRLEIETLLPEQGALFLLRRSRLIEPDAVLGQAPQKERELAVQISQELGGLPLALDQAGAYLEETGANLAEYWQFYQQHRADLLQRRGGLADDHPASVTTTMLLSFQRVEEKNPAAADLLRLCAYLAPDTIPEEILTVGALFLGSLLAPVAADAFLLNQAIEVLRVYSLIRRDPSSKTLSVHRLVQAVLRDDLEETERHSWVERAVHSINAAFPNIDNARYMQYSTWPQCERVLPHALLIIQYIATDQAIGEAGRLLYKIAFYLQDRARYQEAETLYHQTLQIREQLLGSKHPDVASSLNGLAKLYSRQGKYAEAESLYQRALLIREQSLGPGHPDVASSLNGLANLSRKQGKYAEAESLYQRALHIREQSLGLEHSLVASSLDNLALLCYIQGKYAEAESLYQQALRIKEHHLGFEHPLMAISLNGLANLSRKQGKYAEAESLYQRALRIREQHLEPEHPEVAISLRGLANLYYMQGKYAEAEPLYQRALHIQEQQSGPEHLKTSEIIHDLAKFWEAQGNSEEASTLYARALAIREQALGAHHPKTMETRTRLITLLHVLNQHEEAAKLEMAQDES